MKKIFNWMLSASVCASVGLAGCTPDGKVDPNFVGDPTSVEMILSFTPNGTNSAPSTRATSDPNGTDAEAAPHTFDVFVYTGGGDYLDHKSFAAADFTQGTSTTSADVWTAKAPFVTTTGPKNFLVGVNLPTATATGLEHLSMSAASNVAQTIARANITTIPSGGIPMFSTAAVAVTMQAAPATNTFKAEVKRIVAKVTVERSTSPAMIQDGTPGTLGAMSWTINNQNSKYFLLQGVAPNYVDPNWTASQYNAADFHDAATPAVAADWVGVNNGPQTPVSNYNALYALENTSNDKTQKELTRVTVRATFIPSQWVTSYTAGSGTVTRTANSNTSPVTFYTVTPSAGADTEYFQNQADANAYASDKGTTANTFDGGWCYWNIFLHKASRGDVIRNDFYKCNITRVVAPGQNSPTLKDPNAQAQTDTNVTAEVDVLYWNAPVQDNYELVP